MSKILVSYFSASGVTKKVAQKLAKVAGADLFEIVPKDIYTPADLDWTNSKSRSSLEMKDKNCRPAISNKIANLKDYDTIFVGFPIWWYREPSIIDTFMEMYDFSNKRIIPFATSGSSGMGQSAYNLQALAKEAKVANGKRLSSSTSEEELKEWIKGIL